MANYLQLKKDYNNKTSIKNVLSNPGCQFKLNHLGLSLLNNLLNKTLNKINTLPKVDNPAYDYISFEKYSLKKELKLNDQQLQKAIQKLKYYDLINVHEIKGGYTKITYKHFTLKLNNFKKFLLKGIKLTKQKNFVPIVSLWGTFGR